MRLGTLCVLGLALALVACNGRTPVLGEDEIALLRETYPTMTEACIEAVRFQGFDAMNGEVDQCFPMQPARRWKGIWVNEFEGSRFCPTSRDTCEYSDVGENVWLSFPTGRRPEDVDAHGDGTAYVVEFIGRRTRDPANFGHMGTSNHEIIVDELTSIEPVRSD